MTAPLLPQLGIALCGVTAIFLTQSRSASVRRWACIVGLCAQPFWFYATWTAGQWGIFCLTFLYTASWAKGLWTHWIRPQA